MTLRLAGAVALARKLLLGALVVTSPAGITVPHTSAAAAPHDPVSRRPLRVALYPYVPALAEMYWKVEREFEDYDPNVDVRFIDLSADYYGGQLMKALIDKKADVFEIDTVFLRDAVDSRLIRELPDDLMPPNTYLPVAEQAAHVNGRLYGVPHWVCGNFVFFRKDDPEYSRFEAVKTLDRLERIVGRPAGAAEGLYVDLTGRSTLGEKYLDALLDAYGSPADALAHLGNAANPDSTAVRALSRLFALCPGGLCDSSKHHDFGGFYEREFAGRRSRVLIGYSERMSQIVDGFLRSVGDGNPGVGRISFDWNEQTQAIEAVGTYDVEAIGAPLSDSDSKMLAWVDVLSVRADASDQVRRDALSFIGFFNDERMTTALLVPEFGNAPRYLLPARSAVYTDARVLKAAPLYRRFLETMQGASAIGDAGLNDKLRAIGKKLSSDGFRP